jgi:hypothetical protein
MLLFLFITILLAVGFVLILGSSNTKEIIENWPKYRCDPTIMPFAALYGHNTAENFQFCMKDMFDVQADSLLGPFKGILQTLMGTLMTMVKSLMSMRIQIATLVGGVTKLTREFQDRITQVMFRTQITAARIRFLMGRLFGTFYAIIYMGLSGITAVTNFGDTFLFSFLNFLCFPPETLVEIEGRESPIRIDKVKIGDRFKGTKNEITAIFAFYANGQSMVQFPNGLQVSTNHYVKHNGSFIPAGNHPDAKPSDPWMGGYERPLICLNTEDHRLHIQGYEFLDFDETEDGDTDTMKWVEQQLNGGISGDDAKRTLEYSPATSSETRIRMADRSVKPANEIKLGDAVSTGNVVGVIRKKVKRASRLSSNEVVCEGACMWDPEATIWRRAADIFKSETLPQEHIFYGFVVTPTAQIELESGNRIRDYIEVHSPETEHVYAQKIAESGSHP